MLGGFWQFLFFDSVKTYSNSICDYFAVDRDGDGNCDGNSDVAAYASSAAGAFYINLLLKKINTNAKAAKAASKAEGK